MSEQQEFVDFEFEADFENVKEFGGAFPLVDIGHYILEVMDVMQKPSSRGTPMVVVQSKIVEGQETDAAAKFTGQMLFNNYPLTPKALGRIKNLMIACRAPLDKFRASAILGARYRGEVVHSQSSGEPGPDGTPREARTFANVVNEKPLEADAATEAPPPPPPVTKTAAKGATNSKPAATTQTRRA